MKVNFFPKINFKSHYTNADIGASSINGSLKIRTVDDDGKTIAFERTTVFNDGEKRNERKFEENVALKIADYEKRNRNKILEVDKENKTALTICYPGPMAINEQGEAGFALSNFYYDDDRCFRFKTLILPSNINSYLLQNGVEIENSRHVNDMAGAGACILSKIKKYHSEMLKPGKEIIYLYPGGGLGSGIIMVDDDNIKVKPTEIQHIKKGLEKNIPAEANVGANGIVSNFSRVLRLNPEEKQKINSNVKVVCDYRTAKDYFPNITKEQHDAAALFAINEYIDSLAEVIAVQICATKTRDIILVGQIANGIRDAVEKSIKSKKCYGTDEPVIKKDKFLKILKNRIDDKLTPVGKIIAGDVDDLNIKFMQINDNTEGSEILQKSKAVGNPVFWYNISK